MSTAELESVAEDEPILTGEFAALLAAVVTFGLAHSAYFLLPKYLAVELGRRARRRSAVSARSPGSRTCARWRSSGSGSIARPPPFAFAAPRCWPHLSRLLVRRTRLGPWLLFLRVVHGLLVLALLRVDVDDGGGRRAARAPGQALGIFGRDRGLTNALAPAVAEWLPTRPAGRRVQSPTGARDPPACCCSRCASPRTRRLPAKRFRGSGDACAARAGKVLGACSLAGVTFAAISPSTSRSRSSRHSSVSDFLVAYAVAAVIVRALRRPRRRLGRIKSCAGALTSTARRRSRWSASADAARGIGALLGLAHGLLLSGAQRRDLGGEPDDVRGKVMAGLQRPFNVGFSLGSLALGFVARPRATPPVFVLGGAASFAALACSRGARPRRRPRERGRDRRRAAARADRRARGVDARPVELGDLRVGAQPVRHPGHDLHVRALLHVDRGRRSRSRSGAVGQHQRLRRARDRAALADPRRDRRLGRAAQAVDRRVDRA